MKIEQFSAEVEPANIEISQQGGVVIYDLGASSATDRLATIQTPLVTITASGKPRFAVVDDSNSGLEWVIALGAVEGDLQVTSAGVTKSLLGGQARWIAASGEPSPVVSIGKNVETWLAGVRNSAPQVNLSELLLAPANVLADTGALSAVPAPDTPTELEQGGQGVVNLLLDQQGIFGKPVYALEDCNNDGVRDLAVKNGVITLDFRRMLARVQAIDVTILNRDMPGNGLLQGLNPAGLDAGQQQFSLGDGQTETVSLRTPGLLHQARLVIGNACFLGFSLTPPSGTGAPNAARPIVANAAPVDDVVNVLATSAERLPRNGQLEAPALDGDLSIVIDGLQEDWGRLTQAKGSLWTPVSAITFDDGCDRLYPQATAQTDAAGQVYLAYDNQYLYLAFAVNDDGLVVYTGDDQRYFLGDSPQLLLDTDLNDDFDDTGLSVDDIQIDFLPDLGAPGAALWQLNSLASRPFTEALVAVALADTGYFLEAALPWGSLNVIPEPGDRLGIVVSISDNDTPGTNAQECIISTAPDRDWQDPTSWGTVLLRPAGQ